MHIKHIGLDVINQFKYDEVNGGVIRISRENNKVPKANTRGYIMYGDFSNTLYSFYSAHRLVYLLNYPDMDQSLYIDHINGVRTDNRIANLRLVTSQHNRYNRTTAKGFNWENIRQKFSAQLYANKKHYWLGYHDTILDARAAYLRAKKKYHVIEGR